jgi:hypothetical protein
MESEPHDEHEDERASEPPADDPPDGGGAAESGGSESGGSGGDDAEAPGPHGNPAVDEEALSHRQQERDPPADE